MALQLILGHELPTYQRKMFMQNQHLNIQSIKCRFAQCRGTMETVQRNSAPNPGMTKPSKSSLKMSKSKNLIKIRFKLSKFLHKLKGKHTMLTFKLKIKKYLKNSDENEKNGWSTYLPSFLKI